MPCYGRMQLVDIAMKTGVGLSGLELLASGRLAIGRFAGRLFLGLVFCLAATLAMARGQAVSLLLSGKESYYQEVAAAFEQSLGRQVGKFSVHKYFLDQVSQVPTDNAIVAVGSEASGFAVRHFPAADVISLLMPAEGWAELLVDAPGSGRRAAVVIDQPLSRSLTLGKLLMPEAKSASTVFGPISVASKPQLIDAAKREGIALFHAELNSGDNPIGVLAPLVKKADFFMVIADRAVFNRSVAKWLLYLSFRQKVPVIGFSKSYTEAGALASVFSSPENIGRHGGELTSSLLSSGDVESWRIHYPVYYTIEINQEVARALDILVPDYPTLYRKYSAALDPASQ